MAGSWLSIFWQKHLDLSIRAGEGYLARIIERPGLWMPDVEADRLISDLCTVAKAASPLGMPAYGLFSGTRESLDTTVITLVYRTGDDAPVAFNAMPVIRLSLAGKRVDVLHLGLVMVHPQVRGQGLSWVLYGLTCFFLFLRNQLRPLWISSVTQVPAVVGMVVETFSQVFPAPGAGVRRALKQQLIASEIMANHRHVFGVGPEAGFDAERFVITNAYTGGSDALKKGLGEAANHRNPAYRALCETELDYERGDDLLQIGQIDLAAVRRYLTEAVPKRALLQLAVTGLLVATHRLIVPVLHWFDTSRPFGILRPDRHGS